MTATRPIRINRFLALAGLASRRKADSLIAGGRVLLNGVPVTTLATTVRPDRDTLSVDGEPVLVPGRRKTLKFHKPKRLLCTLEDPSGRPTLSDSLRGAGIEGRYFPIGRLDLESSGLLLMTTDGALCYRLTHPSFKIDKTYHVLVLGAADRRDIARLRRGIVLEDGPTQPCRVKVLESTRRMSRLEVTIREGRKRQIRRMMEAVGLEVKELQRIAVGPISLGRLRPGRFRRLTLDEHRALYKAVDLPPAR